MIGLYKNKLILSNIPTLAGHFGRDLIKAARQLGAWYQGPPKY